MMLRSFVPRPPLADFVDLFWTCEGSQPAHSLERILPDGSMQLIINLREDLFRVYDRETPGLSRSFPGCLMSGAHSEFCVIDTAQQVSTMGVHFKPGGAFPFFRLPAGELHGEHVSMDMLWGAAARDLRDRLLEAKTPESRFLILEQTLLAHAALPLERHPAVDFALRVLARGPHAQTISDVTRQVGLTLRRFIQVFRDEVGLTPKLFCRVRRFQRVLRRITSGRPVDWSDVALSSGYFDQAHFIHDFRAFSGLSPTAYVAHRGQYPNHVPLLD